MALFFGAFLVTFLPDLRFFRVPWRTIPFVSTSDAKTAAKSRTTVVECVDSAEQQQQDRSISSSRANYFFFSDLLSSLSINTNNSKSQHSTPTTPSSPASLSQTPRQHCGSSPTRRSVIDPQVLTTSTRSFRRAGGFASNITKRFDFLS